MSNYKLYNNSIFYSIQSEHNLSVSNDETNIPNANIYRTKWRVLNLHFFSKLIWKRTIYPPPFSRHSNVRLMKESFQLKEVLSLWVGKESIKTCFADLLKRKPASLFLSRERADDFVLQRSKNYSGLHTHIHRLSSSYIVWSEASFVVKHILILKWTNIKSVRTKMYKLENLLNSSHLPPPPPQHTKIRWVS